MEDNQILEKLKAYIKENNLNFVAFSNDTSIYSSTLTGIKPAMEIINCNIDIKGSAVGDKVVGKAVALLLVFLGVKSVYAGVISKPALAVLKEHSIIYCYDKEVEFISNRTNTGVCPMEKAVLEISCPKEAVEKIRETILKLSAK